jgi:hypothetical protein
VQKDSRLYRSRGPRKLGLTNGEWVTIGKEAGQWQTGGQAIVEERVRERERERERERDVYCGSEIR